ncbi:MAG: chromate efflux transporter [Planctomycetes bacterium]|nr:chromate efflux transporter [Planctomycetota bacterium]
MQANADPVPFRAALAVWLRVACLSFGGPAGQIAVMHRIVVEEKRWISEARFLHALQFCTLLPGPEAQQLATYLGWLLHGARGGLCAGVLFVLPGALAMLVLSALYVASERIAWIDALFFGVQAAVLAIVFEALLRLGKRTRGRAGRGTIAAAAFAALFFFGVPFPLVIAGAALAGWAIARRGNLASTTTAEPDPVPLRATPSPTLRRALALLGGFGALWALPFALLHPRLGFPPVLLDVASFFSQCAVVTFGGAYAVLAYVADEAVRSYAWLEPQQMIDGLGLAETTPGPLILVLQFVAFLGGWNHAGALSPPLVATIASLVALWVTFVPCFLWIFLGAPYVERLRGSRSLDGMLGGISAAVVGVIANLSLWFALHVLFGSVDEHHAGPLRLLLPRLETLNVAALLLSSLAFLALLRWKLGMAKTLLLCAALGLGASELGFAR